MKIAISGPFFPEDTLQKIKGILEAGLTSVNPREAVRRSLVFEDDVILVDGMTAPIPTGGRVILAGIGKASIPMAAGAVDSIGGKISRGAVITKSLTIQNDYCLPQSIQVCQGDHPIPGSKSLTATREVLRRCVNLHPEDLVICLISGGGSALFTLPEEGVRLSEIQEVTAALLASGADIGEINTVRKHIDRVKGGGFVKICTPAPVLALAISDVIGDMPEVIASGPTCPDGSTYQDAADVISKYHLDQSIPQSISTLIRKGVEGEKPETLKPGDPVFEGCYYRVIASNQTAVETSLRKASDEGLSGTNLGSNIRGEASVVGVNLSRKLIQQSRSDGGPFCMIGGGETTVTLRGNGLGGRNLETAMAAVRGISGHQDTFFVTLGTDGEDGPTDAAGAVVSGETLEQGKNIGLEPEGFLANHDAYHYFERVGGLIKTGSTGTNVMDMVFLMKL